MNKKLQVDRHGNCLVCDKYGELVVVQFNSLSPIAMFRARCYNQVPY
jgi:hypothetical protein